MTDIVHVDLGRARYGPVLELQRRLQSLRAQGAVPDLVLSVEHDPVITVGRQGSLEHILATRSILERLQVDVHQVERGGDVTYHGPGQIVLYPVLDLRERGRDLHRYVANLEEIMLRTAARLGVEAHRRPEFPGIWIGLRKLGSVGVHVRSWITAHGLALNVDLRPNLFSLIVPCGIHGVEAVSLSDILGAPVSCPEVRQVALDELRAVFGVQMSRASQENLAQWMR